MAEPVVTETCVQCDKPRGPVITAAGGWCAPADLAYPFNPLNPPPYMCFDCQLKNWNEDYDEADYPDGFWEKL